jgi:DNA anti-recombination protein RmuC
MELIEGIMIAIIISVAIEATVGGFWHWLGSRELRKGFEKMDERFSKMDKRFESMDRRFEILLKESSEAHTKILEAIKEMSKKPHKKAKFN